MELKDKYEQMARIVEDSVKNISDPKLKLEAFRTIFEDLLKKEKPKSPTPEKSASRKIDETLVRKEVSQDNTFLKKIELSPEELELIYRIDGNNFEIVCNFESNSKWQQIQFVFLTLFGNYTMTKNRRMLSQEVLKKMKAEGFGDLPNLNSFLRELEPKFIYIKTFKEKSKNFFELTLNGIKACEKLVSAIIENLGNTFGNVDDIFGLRKEKRAKFGGKRKIRSPLAKHISLLIEEHFFDNPTPMKEIKNKLEEKNCFYNRDVIDEKIRRVFLGKELRRLKKEGKWHYLKNGD